MISELRYRWYKCSKCAHTQLSQTNHDGPYWDRCRGCSWKGVGIVQFDRLTPSEEIAVEISRAKEVEI